MINDGRIGYRRGAFGWEQYVMTEGEWLERRAKYGVGIITNGIGRRTTSHLFLSEQKREGYDSDPR